MERRRLPYNLILVPAAVLGVLLLVVVDALSPRLPPAATDFEYLFAPIIAIVVANTAYTSGWVVELVLRRIVGAVPRFGPIAWTAGTGLSVLVAFAPAMLTAALWAVRALT